MTATLLAQQLPSPPPRGDAPAGPAPGAGATQAPPAEAPPQPGGLFMWGPLLVMVPLILLLFWQSRSAQKKQQAMISELKKGDRVLTQAGIAGKLIETGERYAKLEIAPGVKIDILKSSIAGKDNAETATAVAEKAEKKS